MAAESLNCPRCGHPVRVYRNPLPTVDVIITYFVQGLCKGVVLVKRSRTPFGWAMPGGFIDYGESAEEAAIREAGEETGLVLTELNQFRVYSDPDRDPRHHTLTVVFTAQAEGPIEAGDDAAQAKVFDWAGVPPDLCFDHSRILEEYQALNRTGKV